MDDHAETSWAQTRMLLIHEVDYANDTGKVFQMWRRGDKVAELSVRARAHTKSGPFVLRPRRGRTPWHICQPITYNRSRLPRNRRGKVAVRDDSGSPRPTGFFPMLRATSTRPCSTRKKEPASMTRVMRGLCLQMHPPVTDQAAQQVHAARVAPANTASPGMARGNSSLLLFTSCVCK